MNSRPEANVSASIPKERTSRLMARQTDSSSSTIAISGFDLLKGMDSVRQDGINLEEFEKSVYWTLVQYEEGNAYSVALRLRTDLFRDAHQFSYRIYLHLIHHPRAMNFDGFFHSAQLGGDLLV